MKKSLHMIENEIYNEYKSKIEFRFTGNEVMYCYVPEKIVYINSQKFLHPDVEFIFDLLHEIGHIQTNVPGMKRCEEEFYATQWAIDEMRKYKLKLSKIRKQEFQEYILKWRETGLSHKAKSMPSKEELLLKW